MSWHRCPVNVDKTAFITVSFTSPCRDSQFRQSSCVTHPTRKRIRRPVQLGGVAPLCQPQKDEAIVVHCTSGGKEDGPYSENNGTSDGKSSWEESGRAKSRARENGFELLREDIRRLARHLSQILSRRNDRDTTTTSPSIQIALFDFSTFSSSSYEPLSRTGKSLVKRFNSIRGSLDRTVGSMVIRVRTLLQTTLSVTQNFVFKGLDNDGWKLLSSFQSKLTSAAPRQLQRGQNVPLSQALANSWLRPQRGSGASIMLVGGLAFGVGIGITASPIATLVTLTTVATTGLTLMLKSSSAAIEINKQSQDQTSYKKFKLSSKPVRLPISPHSGITDASGSKSLSKIANGAIQNALVANGNFDGISVSSNPDAEAVYRPANKTVSVDIDTKAYTVSMAQPSLLTVPVVGLVLNAMDSFAYTIEGVIVRSLNRLGVLKDLLKDDAVNDGWCLLESLDSDY